MNLFNPKIAWNTFADEVNGEYSADTNLGKIICTSGPWTTTFDISAAPQNHHGPKLVTRVRTPYIKSDGFRFLANKIEPSSMIIYKLAKFFGIREMKASVFRKVKHNLSVREPESYFDIQATDSDTLNRFLENETILSQMVRILDLDQIRIYRGEEYFGRRSPSGVCLLCSIVNKVIDKSDKLHDLLALHQIVLEQLVNIGSASSESVDIDLQQYDKLPLSKRLFDK